VRGFIHDPQFHTVGSVLGGPADDRFNERGTDALAASCWVDPQRDKVHAACLCVPICAHHADEPVAFAGDEAHAPVPDLSVVGDGLPIRRRELSLLLQEWPELLPGVSQSPQTQLPQPGGLIWSKSADLHL